MSEDTSETPIQEKAQGDSEPEKSGLWGRMRKGLAKTRAQLAEGVGNLLLGEREISDDVLDELETALLLTDVGVDTTQAIMADLAGRVERRELNNTGALYEALKDLLVQRLNSLQQPLVIDHHPHVVFFVGVNGVGKTTTIGKLAKRFQNEGQSVMLAAGDTFRAAAVEQLKAWGERNDVPVIAQGQGSDSASVVYDAYESARARDTDVLLVDTAGRLQAKTQLMDELKKVHRVVKRLDESAPHDVVLVIDGGVGQNALSQVELFHEAVGLTGLIITKLDGSAKAGVLFAIAAMDQIDIPVHYVGIGEGIDDLREFDAELFVEALLKPGDD